MATLEEASRCPKCSQVGRQGPKQPSAKPGVSVIVFTCENQLCQWYDTGWPVSINPDGTIPDPGPPGPKQFVRPNDLEVAQTMEQVERYADFLQGKSTER